MLVCIRKYVYMCSCERACVCVLHIMDYNAY